MRPTLLLAASVGLMSAATLPVHGARETVPALVRMPAAEEAYDLRIERRLRTRGTRAVASQLAAEMKSDPTPYAKAWYANLLLYGAELGAPELADPPEGFAIARAAAAGGSWFAAELVGRASAESRGTTSDVAEAVRQLRAAAEAGRTSAMLELAKYYFFGVGIAADRATAESWARRAAHRGAPAGLWNLAEWWENPEHTRPADRKKANALYYEAGELGHPPAIALLRERAATGDRTAEHYVHLDVIVTVLRGADALPAKVRESVNWLEEHAPPNDAEVQLVLAELMLEREMKVYDPVAARAKLEYARMSREDDALALQALMVWRGIGEKRDPAAAIAAWHELAERGNARALHQLGWLHGWGNAAKHGVSKDPAKAFTYCRRSADLGYWPGQLSLAECYANGIGTPVDHLQAAKYYEILEHRRYKPATRLKNRMLARVKE